MDIVCDPDDDNRIAIVSADGAIVVVESLSVTWRSECKINDAFRLVEAIVWCGPCLLSSGSGGELRFFSPGPKIRKNPVHHFLSMVLHPLVQIHIFKENHASRMLPSARDLWSVLQEKLFRWYMSRLGGEKTLDLVGF